MAALFAWIGEHADALGVIAQFLTVLVWLVYLQLFLQRFLVEWRPRMLINRGTDRGMASLCLVANMGQQPMFVECLQLVIETGETTVQRQLTETDRPREAGASGEASEKRLTLEGPLQNGTFMSLGTFQELLRHAEVPAAGSDGDDVSLRHVDAIEIRVIATFGPADRPVAGRRRFAVEKDGAAAGDGMRIRPMSLTTERLAGRRQRAVVQQWLRECM